ncbi:unnamed protein product [Calypogeia fissa]
MKNLTAPSHIERPAQLDLPANEATKASIRQAQIPHPGAKPQKLHQNHHQCNTATVLQYKDYPKRSNGATTRGASSEVLAGAEVFFGVLPA